METLTSYSLQVEKGDYLMSWDFKSGDLHLRLHRDMRDYGNAFYRCVALLVC